MGEEKVLQGPTKIGEWTINQITEALKRPLPAGCLKSKEVGYGRSAKQVTYIPWHHVVPILDKYAPGWSYRIDSIITTESSHSVGNKLIVTASITIPCNRGDGTIYEVTRQATGSELVYQEKQDRKTGEVTIKDIAFGDTSSNAESMALRRAASKFQLGLYLYRTS